MIGTRRPVLRFHLAAACSIIHEPFIHERTRIVKMPIAIGKSSGGGQMGYKRGLRADLLATFLFGILLSMFFPPMGYGQEPKPKPPKTRHCMNGPEGYYHQNGYVNYRHGGTEIVPAHKAAGPMWQCSSKGLRDLVVSNIFWINDTTYVEGDICARNPVLVYYAADKTVPKYVGARELTAGQRNDLFMSGRLDFPYILYLEGSGGELRLEKSLASLVAVAAYQCDRMPESVKVSIRELHVQGGDQGREFYSGTVRLKSEFFQIEHDDQAAYQDALALAKNLDDYMIEYEQRRLEYRHQVGVMMAWFLAGVVIMEHDCAEARRNGERSAYYCGGDP